jgi:MFS family permease
VPRLRIARAQGGGAPDAPDAAHGLRIRRGGARAGTRRPVHSLAMASSPSRSLFRHRDFLKLWTGETISQFGTQVSLLAIPLVAITFLDATPLEVGLLGTAEFLPFLLFALPAGAWVDRLRRRPILIAGDLGRAVSLASIPIAYELGALSMWQLYAVGFVNGVLTVFFDVAYQSYLPSLVDRDQIVDGNGKLEISRSSAQIAGPGVSGVLIGIVSAPLAIIADSLSFIGSALFVFGIRKGETAPDRHLDEHGQPRASLRAEVAAGLRYVIGSPYLRWIAAATGWSNLFGTMAYAIYLVYIVRVIGLSPEQIGFVFAAGNIGTLVGALTASRIARALGVGPTIIAALAVSGPGMVLMAAAPPSEGAIPFLVAAGVLFGFGAITYNINQVSLRQAITPERIQGRMNATMRFIVWGTIPVGQIVGGVLGTTIGLRETIAVGAVGSLFAFLPLLVGPLKRLRTMPEPATEGPAAPGPATAIGTVGSALDEVPEPVAPSPLPQVDLD